VDFVTFSDDQMAPPESVWRLADVYRGRQSRHLLRPEDFGLASIGHLDAFSRRCSAVWPALVPEPA
jgi:predicted alpha/beta hydrolase